MAFPPLMTFTFTDLSLYINKEEHIKNNCKISVPWNHSRSLGSSGKSLLTLSVNVCNHKGKTNNKKKHHVDWFFKPYLSAQACCQNSLTLLDKRIHTQTDFITECNKGWVLVVLSSAIDASLLRISPKNPIQAWKYPWALQVSLWVPWGKTYFCFNREPQREYNESIITGGTSSSDRPERKSVGVVTLRILSQLKNWE